MYNNIFATRLRELMKETKTTQQALAKETNITRQAISKYIDGSVLPNIEKLEKISNFFNVSCDYLVGKTNIKTPNTSASIAIAKLTLDNSLCDLCNAINMLDDINDELESVGVDTTQLLKGVDIIADFHSKENSKFLKEEI